MSDDLISRRSILNKTNEWSNKLSCENGKQFTLAEFEHIVANEPAAYDADKVIEEIEKSIYSYELCVETSLKEIKKNGEDKVSFEICSLHSNRGHLNGLRSALEIVKSGGISND